MSGARKVCPPRASAVRRLKRMTAGELLALADDLRFSDAAEAVRLAAELRALEAEAASMARRVLALLAVAAARRAGLDTLAALDGPYWLSREFQDATEHVRWGRVSATGSDVCRAVDLLAFAVSRTGRRRGATRRGGKA